MENEMHRVNSRIGGNANKWLDNRSAETGISKSSLIMLAVENYIRENEAMAMMADMGDLVAKIEELQKMVQQKALD